jgi:ATP-dependent Lon protease
LSLSDSIFCRGCDKAVSETLNLPVLPLDDVVVLPGMVVPVRLADTEARAAIDAAQASGQDQVLLTPRLDGKYAKSGTLGQIEQIGRLPGGAQAAVIRGVSRVQIGAGTTGPGAALWVSATVLDETTDDKSGELARDYKTLVTTVLERRGAWQVIDSVKQVEGAPELADLAGYASYLNDKQKLWLLETPNVSERLVKLITWAKEHLAELEVSESINKDVQEGMEKQQREFLLRQQLAAIRKELASWTGRRPPRRRTIGPGSKPLICRTTSGRPHWPRSTSWSVRRNSPLRSAGSAPGWTPSSNFRGTSGARTVTALPRLAPSLTRTTRVWMT